MTLALSFLFSLVGCFLALHSFVRGIRADGRGRRIGWLLLGAWALAASAVWDLFFIAAIDLQAGGLQVRYEIVPSSQISPYPCLCRRSRYGWPFSTRPRPESSSPVRSSAP